MTTRVRKPASQQPSALDAAAVIDRMKAAFRVKTDADLAAKIDVSTTTIPSWRSRNSLPFLECVHVAEEAKVSLDWLVLGELTLGSIFQLPPQDEPAIDFDLLTAVVRERKFDLGAKGSTWDDDARRARELVAEYQRYAGLMKAAAIEGVSRSDFVKTLRTLVQPAPGRKIK